MTNDMLATILRDARWIAKVAWRKEKVRSSVEFEDLIQEALLEGVRTAKRYDEAHPAGATFRTYAYTRMRGAVGHFVRDYVNHRYRPGYRPHQIHSTISLEGYLEEGNTL